jgi:hypothetical protein
MIMPMINHLAMNLDFYLKFNEEMENLIIKTKKVNGELKMGRRMVAKKRMNMSFNMGELPKKQQKMLFIGTLSRELSAMKGMQGSFWFINY